MCSKVVYLAPVAVAHRIVGPELRDGVDLLRHLVDQPHGANWIEPGGRAGGVEALQVQFGVAFGGPIGEELAHQQSGGLRLNLVPVADVVAGIGVGAEHHVDASAADVGEVGGADVELLGDASSAGDEIQYRQPQVADGVDAAGKAVGAAQIDRCGLIQPVGVVLAELRRIGPAQFGVFRIAVLQGSVERQEEHPQVVAKALSLFGVVHPQCRVEDVIDRLLERIAQSVPRCSQFTFHASCLAAPWGCGRFRLRVRQASSRRSVSVGGAGATGGVGRG